MKTTVIVDEEQLVGIVQAWLLGRGFASVGVPHLKVTAVTSGPFETLAGHAVSVECEVDVPDNIMAATQAALERGQSVVVRGRRRRG